MAYFLGVDAGGSKTEYALADEERILTRAKSGSIKRMRVDAEMAASNLSSALSQLERMSGIAMGRIYATCIGTAGETVPLVTGWLKAEFGKYFARDPLIKGDIEIALEAAFQGRPGILVLAGTGSHVLGRSMSGELYSAGEYGPVLGDQGSGHSIGAHALRAIFLALDEDRKTQLFDAVMAHWRLASRTELIAYANTCPATEYSGLAPLVTACALAGDEVAGAIMEDEARQLGHLVLQVARKIRKSQTGEHTLQFALAGSILKKGVLRELLVAELKRELPEIAFIDKDIDPVVGALSFARQSAALVSKLSRPNLDIPDNRLTGSLEK